MAKSSTFKNDLLKLIFNGVPIANIADNASSSPLTHLWIALHTASPSSGNQTTNEVSYSGYTRMALVRTTEGWEVVGDTVYPKIGVSFPQSGSGSSTATHVSIGTDSSGTGKILYTGAFATGISCASGAIPVISNSSYIKED